MRSQCPACDADVAEDAQYCPRCGNAMAGTVIVVGHETPEPSPVSGRSSGPMPRSTKLAIAGVAAVLVAVLVALTLTSATDDPEEVLPAPQPSPPPTAQPTSRPATDQGAEVIGDVELVDLGPLAWTSGPELGKAIPLAIGQAGDSAIVVATEIDGFAFGLRLSSPTVTIWSSDDLTSWDAIDTTVAGAAAITAATITSDAVVLAGRDTDGAARFWTSPDGVTWEPSEPLALDLGGDLVVSGVAATADATVIGVQPARFDFDSAVRERIGSVADDVQLEFFGTPLRVTARVPPGIVVGAFEAQELGLDDDTASQLFSADPRQHQLWSLPVDGQWTAASLSPAWTISLDTTTDGFIGTFVSDRETQAAWSSPDGIEWSLVERSVQRLVAGGERRLLVDDGFPERLTLDGDRWPVTDLLDGRAFLGAVALTDTVVAASFWQDAAVERTPDSSETVIIIKDGVRLIRETRFNHVRVEDDQASYGISLLANDRVDANVTPDLANRAVRIARPSGAGDVSFSFDELADLDLGEIAIEGRSSIVAARMPGAVHVSPMADVIDRQSDVFSVGVIDDNVVAVIVSGHPEQPDSFSTSLWTAPIPERVTVDAALPDGTAFTVSGDRDTIGEPADAISAALLVSMPNGTEQEPGVLSFRREPDATVGLDGSTIAWQAGDWVVELEVDPGFVALLDENGLERLAAELTVTVEHGLPVVDLPPGVRWAAPGETSVPMEVSYGAVAVRRGCPTSAAACSDDRSVHVANIDRRDTDGTAITIAAGSSS